MPNIALIKGKDDDTEYDYENLMNKLRNVTK